MALKEIIAENSEEKHFVEYGKGIFATDDAVDIIAQEIVKLFTIPDVSSRYCTVYKNKNECTWYNKDRQTCKTCSYVAVV